MYSAEMAEEEGSKENTFAKRPKKDSHINGAMESLSGEKMVSQLHPTFGFLQGSRKGSGISPNTLHEDN